MAMIKTCKMPVLQTKSASGSVATFNTALAMPLASCNIAVNAWQEGSGDPYPAGGSAQIWDEEWELGIIDIQTGNKVSSSTRIRTKNFIPVLPNTTYYKVSPTTGFRWVIFYNSAKQYLGYLNTSGTGSFTSPNDAYYMKSYTESDSYGTTYKNDISINYPATDTAYHPYSNTRPIHGFSKINLVNSRIVSVNKLIPITAKQSGSGDPSPYNVRPITAGLTIVRDDNTVLDVYGGTLDAFSGELTVTRGYKVFNGGTEAWYYREPSNGYYFVISQMKRQTLGDGISNWLKRVNNLNNEFGIAFGYNNSAIYAVQANTITEVADVNSWKQYLSTHNLEVVYDLETPEVIQLSATELVRAKEALGINTCTIQLGEEVYGAEVDVVNGVAHVTHSYREFDGSEDEEWERNVNLEGFNLLLSDMPTGSYQAGLCDKFKTVSNTSSTGIRFGLDSSRRITVMRLSDYLPEITVEAWRTWLETNNISVAYPLRTPFDIQLTPQQIETLIGNNTIFADTGDIDLTYKDLNIAKRGNFREVFRLP